MSAPARSNAAALFRSALTRKRLLGAFEKTGLSSEQFSTPRYGGSNGCAGGLDLDQPSRSLESDAG